MSTFSRLLLITPFLFAGLCRAQSAFVEFNGLANGDFMGRSVASVGDVDGDGCDDVVAGSPGYDFTLFGTTPDVGRVVVSAGRTGETLYQFFGSAAGEQLGFAVDGVGDVNLDGVPDVLVSRPGARSTILGATYYGGAYVYSGATGAELIGTQGVANDDARLGYCAAGIDDINADGRPDFVLGAPYYDEPNASGGVTTDAGAVFVFTSGPFSSVYNVLEGHTSANNHYGFAVDGLGDVNGDGVYDLIIGMPDFDHLSQPFTDVGYVQTRGVDGGVISGGQGSNHSGYRYGAAVAGIGDLNMDGLPDNMVGAPGADSSGLTDNGRAYARSGQGGFLLGTYFGLLTADQAGSSVAAAGDVDGDGFTDVLVGAPTSGIATPFGIIGAGVARLYSGKTDALLETYSSYDSSTYSGTAVAGAGDVNGDGRADIVIGAPSYSGFLGKPGSALLYLGGAVKASKSLYGGSLSGTLRAPAVTLAADPKLCTSNTLTLLSSAPGNAPATLFLGGVQASLATGYGGTLLVGPPWITTTLVLLPGTTDLPVTTPCDATLNGLVVYLQLLVGDTGALKGVSFSQGLMLVHGT